MMYGTFSAKGDVSFMHPKHMFDRGKKNLKIIIHIFGSYSFYVNQSLTQTIDN